MNRRSMFKVALLLGAPIVAGVPAHAQDRGPPVPSADQLDDIIVTAQKRPENVQDIPASIAVVGSEQLDQLHATQLTDIGAYVPGLQIDSGGSPGQTTISIRGIAPIGNGATVGTYLDDTPIGSSSFHNRTTSYALDILPYDVDRIEVLKGPQGTLYGANALGGVVRYVLTKPNLDKLEGRVGGDVQTIAGSDKLGGGIRGQINAPLLEGKIGLLLSGAFENTPGYIDNPVIGAKDYNAARQQSIRGALLWQPSSNLSVQLGAIYQHANSDNNAAVALDQVTLEPIFGRYKNNTLINEPFSSQLQYYTGSINWDFGWAKLVSASSYSYQKTSLVQDASATYGVAFPLFGFPQGISAFDLTLTEHKFTQEFRLASPTGKKVEWLVGLFYANERQDNRQVVTAQTLAGASIPALDPLAVAGLPGTYKEYAAFGDLTFHLTDSFEITGGIRYAKNKQTFRQIFSGLLLPTHDIPGQSAEGVWTYSISPSVHFSKDVMLYARVASGYQAGGPNTSFPGVPPEVKSSTLVNYEAGLKSTFMDNRALLNVTLFDLEWNRIQVVASTPAGISYAANGGRARSRGVEVNASINPFKNLRLSANLNYTDATFRDDAPSVLASSGDRLPLIPEWSESVTASYSWSIGGGWKGSVGAGARFVGERYSTDAISVNTYRERAYTALDLNAAVSNTRLTARIFVKNATNADAYLSIGQVQNGVTGLSDFARGTPLSPRTIGVAIDLKL